MQRRNPHCWCRLAPLQNLVHRFDSGRRLLNKALETRFSCVRTLSRLARSCGCAPVCAPVAYKERSEKPGTALDALPEGDVGRSRSGEGYGGAAVARDDRAVGPEAVSERFELFGGRRRIELPGKPAALPDTEVVVRHR